MSIWTHVVGCIRIDGIVALGADKTKVVKIFGPMCTYDKWNDASTLPRGSEGGLQYQIIEYGQGLRWLVIPIWGDLRDFDTADVPTITKWWNALLAAFEKEQSGLVTGIVRDAVLHIQVEDCEATVLTFKAKGPVA